MEEIKLAADTAAEESKETVRKKTLFHRLRGFRETARGRQKNRVTLLLTQIYLALMSLATIVTAELLQPGGVKDFFDFIDRDTVLFALSVLLVWIAAELVYFLSFKPWLTLWLIYLPVNILALICGLKLEFRDEPLVFADFTMIRETLGVTGDYGMKFRPIYVLAILCFLTFLYLAAWLKKLPVGWKIRTISAVLALALSITGFHFLAGSTDSFLNGRYHRHRWNLRTEYKNNGFVLGFIFTIKSTIMPPPDGYGEQAVKDAAARLGYEEKPLTTTLTDDEKPNIIVIMDESFWDIRQITDAAFSEDPLAVWDSLAARPDVQAGSILSPQFGGGTSNVEYEFLTGMTMRFYPMTANIYLNNIRSKTWSLAWYFKELGYQTQAVHPYLDWFWRRNEDYPLMGFDASYFDTDLTHKRHSGKFIGDTELAQEIIDRVPKDSDRPIFTFAISMENHGPHVGGRYKNYDITVSGLGEDDLGPVMDFTQGVYDAQKMLQTLIEHYEDSERPTCIMMFGDHAPTISNRNTLYIDDTRTKADRLAIRKCPLMLWTNTGKLPEKFSTISTFMLAPELLSAAGLPLTGYQEVLRELKTSTTCGFNPFYTLDTKGNPMKENKSFVQKINDLQLLQYDATYGKHYAVDLFGKQTDTP